MDNSLSAKKKKYISMRTRDTIIMYCFLAPVIIGFIAFQLYPTVTTVVMSFFKWDVVKTREFVGLGNFVRMFTADRWFYISVRVTLIYTVSSVALTLIVGFILASMLSQQRKSVGVFRTIFYIPCMIAGGAPTMMVWFYIFSADGMLNTMLKNVGIIGPNWLMDQTYALPAFIIMSAWGVGGSMLIFIAGLKSIPDEYYESADIDGAGYFRKLFGITIPVLTPTILYNLIMGIIGALQTFVQAYVLTKGGPQGATTFFALHIYNQAFQNTAFGYASSLAFVLFISIMVLTYLIFKTSARWVFYGDGVNR